ncbi:glutathione S-transferase [Aspergillus parasiticus]|uniref:Glutathione S-transferase n=1 Tax=Aspergillus parasiticus TaxID=5067 RepID=A0A5N6E3F5_ASPPA|nr:glutathione S-transferase [Aspergillus parasiticus]
MTFTLYGYDGNTRSRVVRIVAAAEGIELNHFEVIPRRGVNKAEYMARFPRSQGKIPALEGPNIKLTETLSIAMYLASIHGKAKLLGDGSPEQTAEIISWASWANQEFLPIAAQWFRPLIPSFTDQAPYNKDAVEAGKKKTLDILEYLEKYLEGRQYLVTDHITLADIMLVVYVSRLFEWVLGQKWRDEHPAIMQYFENVVKHDAVRQVIPREDFILIEEETPIEDPRLRSV